MNLGSFSFLDPRWHMVIEILVVGLILVAALFWPRQRAPGGFARIEEQIVALSHRPVLAAISVAFTAFALRAALLPVLGPPVPYFPDDFSIMLQGQILALGHFAMPAHPLYPFFESYYVNQLPAYGSMYFPGRGVPLALGNLLFGAPWAGVWLSMIALSVAVLWMLRGWVSAPLALVGAILVVLKFGVVSGWINTYHGGGVAALGGVLLLGAYPRLIRKVRWGDGIAFGTGLFILMISRPFEGLLFSAPLMIALAYRFLPKLIGREIRPLAKVAVPILVLTGAGALLMLSYNAATTGRALTDPYSQHRATHAITPPFLFGEASRPSLTLPAHMERWYAEEARPYERRNSLSGLVNKTHHTFRNMLQFYVGPIFMIPFLVGLFMILARRQFALLASGLSLALAVLVNTWDYSQYWAPGFGLFPIAIMIGFAQLRRWQPRARPVGLFLSRALPGGAALMTAIPAAALYAGATRPPPEPFNRSCCAVHDQTSRSLVIRQLLDSPGRDLVLVRHRADELPFLTLVANDAKIDEAEIVWAHDLGPANRRLFDHFPDRKVWRVEGVADTRAELALLPDAEGAAPPTVPVREPMRNQTSAAAAP